MHLSDFSHQICHDIDFDCHIQWVVCIAAGKLKQIVIDMWRRNRLSPEEMSPGKDKMWNFVPNSLIASLILFVPCFLFFIYFFSFFFFGLNVDLMGKK